MKLNFINFKLISIKIHYLLFFYGMCPWIYYGITIAKNLGFSANTTGLMNSISLLTAISSRSVAGILGDKFHLNKFILVSSLAICAIAHLIVIFVPKRPTDMATLLCNQNNVYVNAELVENRNYVVMGVLQTCKVLDDFSSNEFIQMCNDWLKNCTPGQCSINNSSDFCENLTIEILVTSIQENSRFNGQIWKVYNTDIELVLPHCSAAIRRNATCSLSCSSDWDAIETELSLSEFRFFFLMYLVFYSMYYVSVTLSDTLCFHLVGDQPEKYGQQRMFGSIGWGFSCLIMGFLTDVLSENDSRQKDYTVLFASGAAILILDAVWCCTSLKVQNNQKTVFRYKEILHLFRKSEVLLFMCWTAFFGSTEQIAWNYTFWYFEEISNREQMKWIKSWQGICGFISTVFADGILFFFSGKMIKKYGIPVCMSLFLLGQSVRFFLTAAISSSKPIIIIVTYWLDGVLYGIAYAVVTSYANEVASPGTETTVQALLLSIYDGIGYSVGGFCGGLMYSYFGGAHLFQYMGIAVLCAAFLHAIIQWLIRKTSE